MKTRTIVSALCCSVLCAGGALNGQVPYPNSDSNAPVLLVSERTITNPPAAAAMLAVNLKPTAIAPLRASGFAELRDHSVRLRLSHLQPGIYQVVIDRRADGLVEPLGTVTIVDPTLGPDRQANEDTKEASANPESVLIETDTQIKLPLTLAVTNIAAVQLLSGGNAVLRGAVK